MTIEEMARAYADGYNKEYQQMAYDAFLCGYDAKCGIEPSEELEEAAIQAAQSDMQDRQIMEASNDERMRYSRIFRRGFKVGAGWVVEHLKK